MTPGEAVQAAWEARVGTPLISTTPTSDLVRSVGGSTKAAAQQLGVSQRTVQRQMVAEGNAARGGTQARGTRAVARAQEARAAQVKAEKAKGGNAKFAGAVDIYSKRGPDGEGHGDDYEGYRDSTIDDIWDDYEFTNALTAGDYDAAADALAELYLPGSEFADLDKLEF